MGRVVWVEEGADEKGSLFLTLSPANYLSSSRLNHFEVSDIKVQFISRLFLLFVSKASLDLRPESIEP